MSDQELTDWFVNGEKPWEPGVYNVSCDIKEQSGRWWAAFDGKDWASIWRLNKDRAWSEPEGFMDPFVPKSWRGLAHPPKAKP